MTKILIITITIILSILTIYMNPTETQIPSGLCTTYRWQYGSESAQQAAQLLNYPCYHNWIVDDYGVQNHTKTAYSLQPNYLNTYIKEATINEFWLLGSEPNLGTTYIEPSDAAIFTNSWITQTDTIWACCGTLQHWNNPTWLDWLDSYLESGGAIPDVWHIHIYFVDNTGWDSTIAQFNEWMIINDVVRPIIISETAQTNGNAESLLRHVARAVCNNDVQAIFWYIGDKDAYNFAPTSQLTVDGKITELGRLFIKLQNCNYALNRYSILLPNINK